MSSPTDDWNRIDCRTCLDVGQTCEGYPGPGRSGPNSINPPPSETPGEADISSNHVSSTENNHVQVGKGAESSKADQPLLQPQESMDSPTSHPALTGNQAEKQPNGRPARSSENRQMNRAPGISAA